MERMQRLSETGEFGLVTPEFDPRGWEVLGCDGGRVGEIDELIVDVAGGKIRYASIRMRLWDEWLETRPFRLIAVGFLRLDAAKKHARVEEFDLDDVIGLPAYDGGGVRRELEVALRQALLGDDQTQVGEGFYEGSYYRNEALLLRRQHRIDSRT